MGIAPGGISRSVFLGGGGVAPTGPSSAAAPSAIQVYNAVTYGVPSNGTKADDALNALIATIAGAKATIYFPPGTYGFETIFTFPANIRVWMAKGALFRARFAFLSLTILGEVDNVGDTIFDTSTAWTFPVKASRVQDYNPEWWGADRTGATDSTIAFAACVRDACALAATGVVDGVRVRVPMGKFAVNSLLPVTQHRVVIEGTWKYASEIIFTPTGSSILFLFQHANPALVLYQCGLRHLSITGVGANQKIAIHLGDCSETMIENVTTNAWTGGTSISLRTAGREMLTLRDCDFYADRPMHITRNANAPSLSADHFHITGCIFGTQVAGESGILVDGDADFGISNFSIDGYSSWVGGKYGLRTLPGSAVSALNIRISDTRFEQPADNTGFAIDWQTPLQTLTLLNVGLGGVGSPTNGGLRVRNVTHTLLIGCMYTGTGAAATAIDMDATDRDLRLIQTFLQDSSVVSMPGFEELEGVAGGNSLAPLKPNCFWFRTAAGAPIVFRNGVATHKAIVQALGVGAQFQLTMSSVKTARLRVSAYSATGPVRACGSFHIDATGSTVETDAHANLAAVNTGAKLCTIWSNPSLITLINNLAQPVKLLIEEEWAT